MVLYRFHESRWSESSLLLVRDEFPVIKETKCGVWIDIYGQKRFVNLEAKKKYACRTEEEALESYRARKRRQIKILEHRLAEAKAALALNHDNRAVYFGLDHLV